MVGWEDRGPKQDFLNGMKRQQFKFEKLQVWKDALEVQDSIYELVEFFPDCEKYNLTSQLLRASTSVGLNIAEGSTSSSDKEQLQFIRVAIRSQVEVLGALIMVERRGYADASTLEPIFAGASTLFNRLQAFKKSLL